MFFSNITCTNFVNNVTLNSEDGEKGNQEYGMLIPGEYDNKISTYSIDYNRTIDKALFGNYSTQGDLFLNTEDYVTSAPLLPDTDEWPLKKAQSNVENSHALLMAIKPLSSEMEKLLNAVKLVNRSLSDVQNRLCDKKNVRSTRSKDRIGEEFLKSGNVERRKLPHSRFNRNLKSLAKNYKTRVKPMRQYIESGLKKMKRTTPFLRSSRLIKNNVLSKNNFVGGRGAQNYQITRSIISPNKAPTLDIDTKKDSSAHFFSNDKRDLTRRNMKRAMSSTISNSDKEKEISPTDSQFYKEATAYHDILKLLDKTEKPHIEYTTAVWATQNLTESLPSLIFRTTEFSALTFLPYFTEAPTLTASSIIAEKKEISEVTESSLYEYVTVTDFAYSEAYKRNYTGLYNDYEKDLTSKISEIISLTQSPVTLNAFTITMPTTLPLFYTTELTILPIDEAVLTTEISTTISMVENFTTESVMLLTPFLEG
ncbi:uncharacterized protein LOC120357768, partial [Solenopsis invicta]|uniref:uncharacterized protein LOC120357768 n=1 Tax=Solenopsis invicta TaxID=13686 RepID=UPI00193C9AB0